MSNDEKILVLGAGLTGLSAAYHLEKPWTLIEKETRPGGLARTEIIDGHKFDMTGHWLHLRNGYIKTWLKNLLADRLARHERRAHIFSNGVYTGYPYQVNTFGLPKKIIDENLNGFLEAAAKREKGEFENPANFKEWILQNLGAGFAKNFMLPYNEKIWTVPAEEISCEWCERFVPKPSADDVIRGSKGQSVYKGGYNASFLYPREGGIELLPKTIFSSLSGGDVILGDAVKSISLKKKELQTVSGKTFNYSNIVSSLPLKHLVGLIKDAPDDIKNAADKLKYTSVIYYNLATENYETPGSQWVYYPEKEYKLYRLGSFSEVNQKTATDGRHSLYAEIAIPGGSDALDVLPQVIDDLLKTGVIDSKNDIIFAKKRFIECAYIIMNKNYRSATKEIQDFLVQNSVVSTGRYGKWTYSAMEDALLDGLNAAKNINSAR